MSTFDHVGLTVADLDAMTRWYFDALDLEVEFESALDHVDLADAMLVSPSDYRIELLCRSGCSAGLHAANPVEAALTRGFGHVAFDVPARRTGSRAYSSRRLLPTIRDRRRPRTIRPSRCGRSAPEARSQMLPARSCASRLAFGGGWRYPSAPKPQ